MKLLLFALSMTAWAHGVHASLGTAQYSAASKSLEITLVFSADDIEALLRKETGKQIEVECGGADKLVFAYIERCIEWKSARGGNLKMNWIGLEASAQKVTAYLEVKVDEWNGLKVRNDLLFDLLPDQVNMMSIRRDKSASSDHLFRTRGEWQPVKLP